MCCWTRSCSCHFEATCVLRVVRTVEIPAPEHGGAVDSRAGGTDMFKSPQAEDRAEAEFCTMFDEAILSTSSHLAVRK